MSIDVSINPTPTGRPAPSTSPQCPPSGLPSLERTRFFARQLVGPDDLTQDQLYLREKLRRHNRMLHGWGIVCGCGVRRDPRDKQGCTVLVDSGYILGPYGDEILVEEPLTVDLCHESVAGDALDPCAGVDPWCRDVRGERDDEQAYYLAIRYEECPTRPVRVYGCDCGCDEADCEYSRVRDSYVIRVLHELPDSYAELSDVPNPRDGAYCAGEIPGCPDCPTDPWVLLCGFTLRGDRIESFDCDSFRRYARTNARQYYICAPGGGGFGGFGKVSNLRDTSVVETTQPTTLALLHYADGSPVSVPIFFTPQPGDTYASLAEREGARMLVDDDTGETVTFADLLALAGVEPQATVGSVDDLREALDGVELAGETLTDARAELHELYDAGGRERMRTELLDSPAAAVGLPATTLKGVEPGSKLGNRVSGMSVRDVAGRERDAFVRDAIKGARGAARSELEKQAGAVWDRARAAVEAADRLGPKG